MAGWWVEITHATVTTVHRGLPDNIAWSVAEVKGCQIPALRSCYQCTDFACYITMILQHTVNKWEYYPASPYLFTSTENYKNCILPSFVIKTKFQSTSHLIAYFRLTAYKFEKTPCLMVLSETKLFHDMDALTFEQSKSIQSNINVCC
jgi:hypothetical protein